MPPLNFIVNALFLAVPLLIGLWYWIESV
jgi:hypothetical protein